MVNLLLTLALFAQQPQVEATVDRSVAEVGDDIVVTVKVVADGGIPTEASVPPFTGLDLTGTSQSSVFTSANGRSRRETIWEYRFRATMPGRAVIGPIRVRVGVDFVDAGQLSVDVTAAGGTSDAAFDERVAAIVDRAPGPGATEDVTVTVIPSRDTIVLGEQLDLVVVAWFPRDIRQRLRTRPTLMPPELQGAWTYPRAAALGVVATRTIDGRLYDLFVHHQAAFPLTPGELHVGHATVSYSLPLRTSILSREIPQEVQSPDTVVTVLPQPVQGRPDGFTGVAARDLRFTVAVDTGDFGVGNASAITARVTGQGTVSLWPKPEFEWPEGVRVYEGRTDVDIDVQNGLIGGTKTFTYLIAPESTGTYVVPPPTYTYFALDSGRYVQTTTPPIQLVARAVRPSATRDRRPPAILARRGVSALDSAATTVRLWILGLMVGLPPVVAGVVRGSVRIRRRRKPVARVRQTDPTLETLEREFRAKLEQLIPGLHAREGDGLPAALRAAGVETPVAIHAGRVRDRLRQALYGRDGASDPVELAAEVHEVLRALPGGTRHGPGIIRVASLAVLMMLTVTGIPIAAAQTPSAEQLYEAGAYRAAADSFHVRVSEEPLDASQWFNTGAALFGAGEKTAARVAWIRAARLVPRDRAVRAALALVPPVDANARAATRVAPVSVIELATVAMLFWVVGWLAYAFSIRARRAMSLVALGIVTAALAGYLQYRYSQPIGLITTPNVPMLEAPYGSADATTRLDEGTAVRVVGESGSWLRVSRGPYQGWVLTTQVWQL